MRIAVFGKNGQVATELQRRVPENVVVEVLGRDRADFSKPEMVFEAGLAMEADAVINAVAYTAVDKAEWESELAELVNGASVGALARACAKRNTPIVHVSTDYVFRGDGEAPWSPDDTPEPLGVYGKSKLIGENAIRELSANRHAILRTSWVFSAHGTNFVKAMLRLGSEQDRLTIVSDQVGGPTPAGDIAEACFSIAEALVNGATSGTYHYSGAPNVSWADFAREIFSQAGMLCEVEDIPSKDFPKPAERPLNSRLDCATLENEFGLVRPDWRKGLADVLSELGA